MRKLSIVSIAFVVLAPQLNAEVLQCPTNPTPDTITSWRLEAATGIANHSITDAKVRDRIKSCFPSNIPQCLKRTSEYVVRGEMSNDPHDNSDPHFLPPKELLKPGASQGEYIIPENLEQIAADKGWPAVRYKSRHSGGFDSNTPSLIMVLVPGEKVDPPVTFDRWLNFAIPADTGQHAMTPKPQARIPDEDDYDNESRNHSNLPRTFTMVSLEKKTDTKDAEVYFSMFHRDGTGNRVFRPTGAPGNLMSCVSCHPNGLRAISPLGYHVRKEESQLPAKDWETVKVINSAMEISAGYSTVSWRGPSAAPLMRMESVSPSIGPVIPFNDKSRTEDFILGVMQSNGTRVGGCYKTRPTIKVVDIFGRAPGLNNIYSLSAQPSIRWEAVRDAMECSSCHNGSYRSSLNSRVDGEEIDFKILTDQSMPMGSHLNPGDQGDPNAPVQDSLTPDERIALANCLFEEFKLESQQIAKWLTESSCN